MSTAEERSSLPTDPREALGPSLFISILHHLPFPSLLAAELVSRSWRNTIKSHENGLWRATCRRTGVEPKHMKQLEQLEQAMATAPAWGGDPEEPEPVDPEESGGSVDWRGVCKGHVEHDRNWRFGRTRERWITPEGNNTWRIKVDPEQGTVISTTRNNHGLIVSDLETSQTLFKLENVHEYAHLEFAKGFVVYNGGPDGDGLYVYRTQQAINRSAHPTPSASKRPLRAEWGVSCRGLNMSRHTGPLPTGHLSFYRHIVPPTVCRAFRARVDREGTQEERAMLGTASAEAVYLWDLDDSTKSETIPIEDRDQSRIQYIEFDDDFVFLCTKKALIVYSRSTRRRVYLLNASVHAEAGLRYQISSVLGDQPVIHSTPREGYTSTPTSRVSAQHVVRTGGIPPETIASYLSSRGGPNYIACHYTTTELICLSRHAGCLIIRDYKRLFHEECSIWNYSIWIGFEAQLMCLLATHDTRVGIATDRKVYFFDTSTFPQIPLGSTPDPPSLHIIRSTSGAGVMNSSCLQMDRSNMYLSLMTSRSRHVLPVDEPSLVEDQEGIPEVTDMDCCCVKAWNFTP